MFIKLKDLVFSIYLIILLFCTSVVFVLNSTIIYLISIYTFRIREYTNLSTKLLMDDYTRIINYLNNPFIDELKFKNFTLSNNGAYHFYEVKNIIQILNITFIICVIIAFILNYLNNKKILNFNIKIFNNVIYSIIFFSIFLAIGILKNFEYLFEKFHKIIFNNNYWIFDANTDSIIKALPEEFFLTCTILIMLIMLILSVLLKKYIYITDKKIPTV